MTNPFDGVEITVSGTDQNTKINSSVIWLHGLGADGNDFAPLVPELEKLGVHSTRFIFPHAPTRPVTINGGMPMRAWYDITSLDFDQRRQDEEGTKESQQLVNTLIDQELSKGIEPEKIVIAGFSQGGAIALHTALRRPEKLAGIMALSTYLPLPDTLANEKSAHDDLPIFMAHGVTDDVIAIRYAEASREVLKSNGYKVEWHTYPMPHSVSPEEIVDIANWLKRVLGQS